MEKGHEKRSPALPFIFGLRSTTLCTLWSSTPMGHHKQDPNDISIDICGTLPCSVLLFLLFVLTDCSTYY